MSSKSKTTIAMHFRLRQEMKLSFQIQELIIFKVYNKVANAYAYPVATSFDESPSYVITETRNYTINVCNTLEPSRCVTAISDALNLYVVDLTLAGVECR